MSLTCITSSSIVSEPRFKDKEQGLTVIWLGVNRLSRLLLCICCWLYIYSYKWTWEHLCKFSMTTFVKVILQGWNHGIGVCLRPRASLVCGQDSLQQGESPAQPWVKIKASPIFSRLFLRTFLHLVVKSVFLWKSFNCIVLNTWL